MRKSLVCLFLALILTFIYNICVVSATELLECVYELTYSTTFVDNNGNETNYVTIYWDEDGNIIGPGTVTENPDGSYTNTITDESLKENLKTDIKINFSTKTGKIEKVGNNKFEFKESVVLKDGQCPDLSKKTSEISMTTGQKILKAKFKSSKIIYEDVISCNEYEIKEDCESSGEDAKIACIWNVKELNGQTYEYCNVDNLLYVSCGDARDIPIQVPALISFFVNFLKIVTPIILIFIGIITLVKALAASKEDEIKKAQGSLVKKIIAAAMVFFVVTIVQFVISLVADAEYESDNGKTEKDNFSSCLQCFLTNNCENTAYYKTNIAGQDYCTDLDSENFELCPEENVQ